MISIKIYKQKGEVLLAACDQELLGKEFKENDLILRITEDFYCEKVVEEEEFLEHLDKCTTANLVGEKTIRAYRSTSSESTKAKKIAGVPHLQVYQV